MKFSIKDFFSKCDQIRSKLRIWSHLLKKSLLENFIFGGCDRRAAAENQSEHWKQYLKALCTTDWLVCFVCRKESF